MLPEILLSQFWGKVAHDYVSILVEPRLHYTHVDRLAINLSVVHLLLAAVGFFNGGKCQETKPLLSFVMVIIFGYHFGVKHFVASAFEEL